MSNFRNSLLKACAAGELDYSKWRGVFIEDVNGDLWNIDDWDGSVTFNSVAVINDVHSFGIAQFNLGSCEFSSPVEVAMYGAKYDSFGRVAYHPVEDAYNDMDGEGNTQLILASQGAGSTYAAQKCKAYEFANGLSGYLMAAGEYKMIVDNITEINRAIDIIDGTQIEVNITSPTNDGLWTSTLGSDVVKTMTGYRDWDFEIKNPSYADKYELISHATYNNEVLVQSMQVKTYGFGRYLADMHYYNVSIPPSGNGRTESSYLARCRPLCRLSKVNL